MYIVIAFIEALMYNISVLIKNKWRYLIRAIFRKEEETAMEFQNSYGQNISKKIASLGKCGIQLCDLGVLERRRQEEYAGQISQTIDDHPEFKMLSLTPEEIMEKHMLVAIDEKSDKLVACGGSNAETGGQMEIGTLFTVPDLDHNGQPYRNHGLGTLITAMLTHDTHRQGYDALAFCNDNSVSLFKSIGYHEAYLQDEVNAESLSYCKDECVAWKQATDKINKDKLFELIEATEDLVEKDRLAKYLVKLELGSRVLRCCDTVLLLSQGAEVKYSYS